MLLHQHTSTNNFFSNDIKTTGIQNPNDASSDVFSIVGAVDSNDFIDAHGAYQFRLAYGGGATFDQIWTQTSWLMESSITGSSRGYSNDCGYFMGLGLSDSTRAFLDGNAGINCWWQAAGLTQDGSTIVNGLMPVEIDSNTFEERVDLYVCTTGMCDERMSIYVNYVFML